MKKNKKKKTIDLQARRERIENWKNIGGSLFSNQRAIDAGTHNPWWAALIVFILSVFIPVIPMLTQGFTASGADMIARQSFGLDTTIASFAKDLTSENINLQVNDEFKLLDMKVEGSKTWEDKYGYSDKIQYSYVNANTHQYDLLVYYTPKLGKEFDAFTKTIAERNFIQGTIEEYVEKEVEPNSSSSVEAKAAGEEASESTTESSSSEVKAPSLYMPNIIVMNKEVFIVSVYQTNTITRVSGIAGDYLSFEAGYNLKNIATVEGFDAESSNIANVEYTNKVFDNFRYFLDRGYLHNRNMSATISSCTGLGIFAALGFFMGLMIFLLTRGKRNINRRLTFLQCEKIVSWAMLCPGILGLIMGYIIPNGAIMFFIIFLGIRIMWMSMKQLRPVTR